MTGNNTPNAVTTYSLAANNLEMATTRTKTTSPRIVHIATKVTTSSTAEIQLVRRRDVREKNESTLDNVSTIQINGTSTLPASRTIYTSHDGAELSNTTKGTLTSRAGRTIHPTQVGAVSSITTKRTSTLNVSRPVKLSHVGTEIISSNTNRTLTSPAGRTIHPTQVGAVSSITTKRTSTLHASRPVKVSHVGAELSSNTNRTLTSPAGRTLHSVITVVSTTGSLTLATTPYDRIFDAQANCLCKNGGSCHKSMHKNKNRGYYCLCPTGIHGDWCERKSERCCHVQVLGFLAISTGGPAIVGYYLVLCWMKQLPYHDFVASCSL